MDIQVAFNIAIALVAFLGGWVLNSLKESINQLKVSDGQLADKVQHIEVLVAGNYITRDAFDKLATALFTKLDRIELKVDGKADK
jgi:hypothetical protein